jgi:hypothetical protein
VRPANPDLGSDGSSRLLSSVVLNNLRVGYLRYSLLLCRWSMFVLVKRQKYFLLIVSLEFADLNLF